MAASYKRYKTKIMKGRKNIQKGLDYLQMGIYLIILFIYMSYEANRKNHFIQVYSEPEFMNTSFPNSPAQDTLSFSKEQLPVFSFLN